jgi:hypothetical protein
MMTGRNDRPALGFAPWWTGVRKPTASLRYAIGLAVRETLGSNVPFLQFYPAIIAAAW